MASNRIGRINEEIQRELSALIRTVKDPRVPWDGLGDSGGDHLRICGTPRSYVSVLDKERRGARWSRD